jgi:hypothetical protein
VNLRERERERRVEGGVIRLKLITSSRRFKGFCGFGFSEDFTAHTPKECASEPSRADPSVWAGSA